MDSLAFARSYLSCLPAAPALQARLEASPSQARDVFVEAFAVGGSCEDSLRRAGDAARPLYQAPPLDAQSWPPLVPNEAVEGRCRNLLTGIQEWSRASGLQVSLQLTAGFPPLAAALPGHVFVDAPRADKLSDGALTFLLAHELGHLAHGDHAAEAGREKALELLTLGLEPFDLEAMDRLAPVLEASQSLEREQEREADRFGAQATRALGYDPLAAAREVLCLLYQDNPPGSSLERTHGSLAERLDSLNGL